ncbi:hypothetical protein GCM10025767_06720 [Thalassotalea piscium]|uniref:Uncharacterized protein n=1 Tax=Thalassotalea piscium TaxID=1230533 RepID=A0A7X0NKK1_9GAMM|nr:hypothetical protein [Thalassotalea piscium]
MNCHNCYYMKINKPEDNGHCYMFKTKTSEDCKQFTRNLRPQNNKFIQDVLINKLVRKPNVSNN